MDGTLFIKISLIVPPPTAVKKAKIKTPKKLKLFSKAIIEPVMAKETKPMASDTIKAHLPSKSVIL